MPQGMDIVEWLREGQITEEDILQSYEEDNPGFMEEFERDPKMREEIRKNLAPLITLTEGLKEAADTIEELRWELEKAQKEE
jgi:hypothetical protein